MNALALTDHGNLHGALEFYKKAQGRGDQSDHRLRSLHRPRQPLRQERRRQQQGSELSPHAARPEPHRLQKPDQAGLGRLCSKASTSSRGSTRNCSQRHSEGIICLSRLRIERIQPRDSQRRRRPKSDFKEAMETAQWFHKRVRRSLLHRDHEQRRRDPADRNWKGPSISPSSSACRWWRPATAITSIARMPKRRT